MADSDWDEDITVSSPKINTFSNENQRILASSHDKTHHDSSRSSRPYEGRTVENDNQFFEKMTIDSSFTGLIIGKGGSTIKRLQDETYTHIKVVKNVSDDSKTNIFVRGNESDVKSAVERIESMTKPRETKRTFFQKESNTNIPRGPIRWDVVKQNSEILNRKKFGDLPEIKKVFYNEAPHISQLSESEVEAIRFEKNKICVCDINKECKKKIPNPILSFSDAFGDYEEIMAIIKKAGFKEPSPIQCQAWPIIMSGYDLIGIAQTGTGKTLAFLLPALIHIDSQQVPREERPGPSCLILSPTRELAQQIHAEVQKFKFKGIKSTCIYGGGSRSDQIMDVENGVEIVIATPGRLNDLIMNNILSLTGVTFLVLDEADRMLDLGFEPEIRKALLDVRPDRQTVMTSATWPPGVTRLINSYMRDPIQINVGSLNLTACQNVEQRIEFLSGDQKLANLKDFIMNVGEDDKTLVFVGRKITADHVASDLILENICNGGIQTIHGNREQCDREQALSDFKDGSAKVLIATDVASRGLDICDINYVINYDFPKNIEEYVHRIGRTGRAGKSGISISYITREDWGSAKPLIDVLTDSKQHIPDELYLMAERFLSKQRERELLRNQTIGGQSGGFGTKLCRRCGMTGHLSKACPMTYG